MKNLLISFLLFLQACSLSTQQEAPTRAELAKQNPIENPASSVSIEPFASFAAEAVVQEEVYGVELSWDKPEQEVDSFTLFTGSSPQILNVEIKVKPSELQLIEGNKYKYIIRPVKKGEPLYVSIAAEISGKISERTNPILIDTK